MPSDPTPVPTELENPVSLEILNNGLKRVLEIESDQDNKHVPEKRTVESKVDNINVMDT
jgi:hypothetical protein